MNKNIDRMRDDIVRFACEVAWAVQDRSDPTFDSLRMAVTAYEAATKPKFGEWMPSCAAKPEHGSVVLATLEDGSVVPAHYSNRDFWPVDDQQEFHTMEVIAWMPLPEPYRER